MKNILESTRYVAYIAIFALLVTSLVAFGWGAFKSYSAIAEVILSLGKSPQISIVLIEVIDTFLIAIILFISAVSIYELFIDDLPGLEKLVAHNLNDLKAKLGSVLILVMAFKFVEHFFEWKDAQQTLLFGLAAGVISATLIAFSYFGSKGNH